jgi:hypothetical protein
MKNLAGEACIFISDVIFLYVGAVADVSAARQGEKGDKRERGSEMALSLVILF